MLSRLDSSRITFTFLGACGLAAPASKEAWMDQRSQELHLARLLHELGEELAYLGKR
jgi:hypothetical protein